MKSGINGYAMQFYAIGGPSDWPLRTILNAVNDGIREAALEIAELRSDDDVAYQNYVEESASETVEGLLGIAFIACQPAITGTVAAVQNLYRFASSEGVQLTTVGPKPTRPAILSACSPPIAGKNIGPIEVLDAFANYFKHRDEWQGSWADLPRHSASTANAIQRAGATEGSSGNLRVGAECLGNASYDQADLFADYLEAWVASVRRVLQAELKTLGKL